MKRNEVDKRIVRTKAAIRSAFLELVQQQDMSLISISSLVDRAGITRSTFYMYYDSVTAVRDDIEDEIIRHIEKIMDESDWLNCMVNPYVMLDAIAKEIARYDEYNRYLLSGTQSGRLLDKLNQRVVEAFVRFVKDKQLDIDVARAKYIAAFVTAGIGACFKLWYNHRSSLTLEELCKRISEMITCGLSAVGNLYVEK